MRTDSSASPAISADPSWRIGIVSAPYYKDEMDALVAGARKVLIESGIKEENIIEAIAPGSFEVPLLGKALAQSGKVDALIGLGIIVEGETFHAKLLAEAATKALMDTQMVFTMPFGFELLYVHNLDQVRKRLDKGGEAARAVLLTLVELRKIKNL